MNMRTAFIILSCIGMLATAAFGQGITGTDPIGNQQTGAGSSGMGSGSGMDSAPSGMGSESSGINQSGIGSIQGVKSISGEILRIQDDLYYVKDPRGKEVVLHVDESTQKSGEFREGDNFKAEVTEGDHVLKLEKADDSLR
jgi:hypothetical protein